MNETERAATTNIEAIKGRLLAYTNVVPPAYIMAIIDALDGATRSWDAAQAYVDVLLARVEKLERERDAATADLQLAETAFKPDLKRLYELGQKYEAPPGSLILWLCDEYEATTARVKALVEVLDVAIEMISGEKTDQEVLKRLAEIKSRALAGDAPAPGDG